jgi:hypothetical protein
MIIIRAERMAQVAFLLSIGGLVYGSEIPHVRVRIGPFFGTVPCSIYRNGAEADLSVIWPSCTNLKRYDERITHAVSNTLSGLNNAQKILDMRPFEFFCLHYSGSSPENFENVRGKKLKKEVSLPMFRNHEMIEVISNNNLIENPQSALAYLPIIKKLFLKEPELNIDELLEAMFLVSTSHDRMSLNDLATALLSYKRQPIDPSRAELLRKSIKDRLDHVRENGGKCDAWLAYKERFITDKEWKKLSKFMVTRVLSNNITNFYMIDYKTHLELICAKNFFRWTWNDTSTYVTGQITTGAAIEARWNRLLKKSPTKKGYPILASKLDDIIESFSDTDHF